MSAIFIIATPIGNLKDITQRALETLKEVDLILAEDTRTTCKLLFYYNIKKPLLSYYQHSSQKKINQIIDFLREGKKIALLSEAGTPGISDPGNKLIEEIIKNLPFVKIVPIPGASALIAALSVSGFPTDRFLFLGFPPAKKRRKEFFEEIKDSKYTVVFYESPFRLFKTLNDLSSEISPLLDIVVCKELTKKFETIYRGKVCEVLENLKREKIKGEFTIVVDRRLKDLL